MGHPQIFAIRCTAIIIVYISYSINSSAFVTVCIDAIVVVIIVAVLRFRFFIHDHDPSSRRSAHKVANQAAEYDTSFADDDDVDGD